MLTKNFRDHHRCQQGEQAEFDQLLADFRDIYPPGDIEVDLLVQDLADSWWKSARALRAERGELTLKSEIPHQDPELSESELTMLAPLSDAEVRFTLFISSRGLNYLIQRFEDIVKSRAVQRSIPRMVASR